MELKTPRLRIRELRMDAWTVIHRYASDPAVTGHMI